MIQPSTQQGKVISALYGFVHAKLRHIQQVILYIGEMFGV